MQHWRWPIIGGVTLCALSLLASSAFAQTTPLPRNVTVAFGAGLNTEGANNQVIIPGVIRVRDNGVVHFTVGGFHQIVVYDAGTTSVAEIENNLGAGLFINYDPANQHYLGQSPTTSDPNFSNAQNRVESVYFGRPGNYLVICNVQSHFAAGMHASVRVRPYKPRDAQEGELGRGTARPNSPC